MVLDFIKNRRTIRKYKKDMPDRGFWRRSIPL